MKFVNVAVLFGFIMCASNELLPNLEYLEMQNSVANSISRLLLDANYNTVHFHLVARNYTSEDLISSIVHTFEGPVEINTRNFQIDDAVVVFDESVSTFVDVPNQVGFIIWIINTDPNATMEVTTRISNKLWSLKTTKIAIVMLYQQHIMNISMISSCKTRHCETIHPIISTSLKSMALQSKPLNITTEQKTTNFQKCIIDVGITQLAPFAMIRQNGCAWDYFGLEVELMKVIAQYFNFQVRFVQPPVGMQWGDLNENGSTGLMGMIQSGQVDLAIGSIARSVARNTLLKAGTGNFYDKVIFALPPGIAYSPLEKLMMPVSTDVWYIIIAACFIVSILISIDVNEQFNRIIIGKQKAPLTSVWLSLLGGAMPSPPKATFSRSVLIGWLYVTLVIRTAYQAVLFGHLRCGDEFKPISTLADIDEAGLRYYMYNVTRRYFVRSPQILERAVIVKDNITLQDYLNDIADNVLTAAFPLPQSNVAYFNKQRNVKSKAHISGYVVESYEVAIHYPLNSSLTVPIDELVLRIRAAGLHEYWARQFQGPKEDNTLEPRTLHIENLQGAFMIHAILCGFCCIVMIVEFVAAKAVQLFPRKQSKKLRMYW